MSNGRNGLVDLGLRRQRGISMVEALIGVAVGIVASIVILKSYSASEAFRRSLSGSADASQTASIVGASLDMLIQQAGASLVQGRNVWGCRISATKSGTALLPREAAFDAPFASVPQNIRVLPVGILSGGSSGSDVIVLMAGASASGNRGVPFDSTGTTLVMKNAIGVGLRNATESATDLFLAVPQDVSGDLGGCQIVQAATSTSTGTLINDPNYGLNVVPAEGAVTGASASYTTVTINSTTYGALASTSNSPSAFHLGREDQPILSLLGVNSNNELVDLDLLNRRATLSIGENVFMIKALYGVDDGGGGGTANDNVIDSWISPATTGWTLSTLMGGAAATAQKIDQIKAIRLGLVLRSSQYVNSDAAQSSITLFSDLGDTLKYTRTLSSSEKGYQYQVFDWVIPLRNMKLIPKS